MAEKGAEVSHDQFTVGWICALECELAAADVMMDEKYHNPPGQDPNDPNHYSFGRIGNYKIVYACLVEYGTTSAANLATQMLRSFPSIKFGLMIGIGGGVPSSDNDIRLGDVVVSKPDKCNGGVVQYDMGKRTPEGKFERVGTLNKPPLVLRSAMSEMMMDQKRKQFRLEDILAETLIKSHEEDLSRPDERDDLYDAGYQHPDKDRDCNDCDRKMIVKRSKRSGPKIHYGTIASGNSVVKDAIQRDQISRDLEGVKCFEMEAAGLMDEFPCLIIRGICDYADSHKNKAWQRYAAMTAAAYGKRLLLIISPRQVDKTTSAQRKLSIKVRALPASELPSTQKLAVDPYQYQISSRHDSFHHMTPPQEQQRQMDGSFNPYPFGLGPGNERQPLPGSSPPDQYQAFSYNRQSSAQQSGPPYPFNGPRQDPCPTAQTTSPLPSQLQPGTSRPPPYPSQNTSQRFSAQLQRPSTLNQVGHSDSDLARLGGKSWSQAGIARVPVGSQPGRHHGYQQPPGMAYAQASRTNHPIRPSHPNHSHSGPPIPLKDLPKVHADPAPKKPSHATYLAPHATSSRPHLPSYPANHSSTHSATHSASHLATHTATLITPPPVKYPAKHPGTHSQSHLATYPGITHKIKHGLGHGKHPKPKKNHKKKPKTKHSKHDKKHPKLPGLHHGSHSSHNEHASDSSDDEGHNSDSSDEDESTSESSGDEQHNESESSNDGHSFSDSEAEENDDPGSPVDVGSDSDDNEGYEQQTGHVPSSTPYNHDAMPYHQENTYDHHEQDASSSEDDDHGFHQAEADSSHASYEMDYGSDDDKEDQQGDDDDDCCGDCCGPSFCCGGGGSSNSNDGEEDECCGIFSGCCGGSSNSSNGEEDASCCIVM